MRGRLVLLTVVVLAVFLVGVGAIAVVLSSGGGTAIVDLDVGDCFDLPDDAVADGTVDSVDTVDCSTPHLAEVVFRGELNSGDDPYPSDDELFASVDKICREAQVVDTGVYGLLPIAPTLELWESFEGRFLCVAIPFGGSAVTGSARSG
jgi:hypothetical protein